MSIERMDMFRKLCSLRLSFSSYGRRKVALIQFKFYNRFQNIRSMVYGRTRLDPYKIALPSVQLDLDLPHGSAPRVHILLPLVLINLTPASLVKWHHPVPHTKKRSRWKQRGRLAAAFSSAGDVTTMPFCDWLDASRLPPGPRLRTARRCGRRLETGSVGGGRVRRVGPCGLLGSGREPPLLISEYWSVVRWF